MKFTPQHYSIPDEPMKPFIDPQEIWDVITRTESTPDKVRAVIQHALNKNRLTLEETAVLINASSPELIEEIKEGARTLKRNVYGDRIVLFAPLYIGNQCTNNCAYCGFRTSNTDAVRKTLEHQEIIKEVEALQENGQKRLILVYGEHPDYSADYIAETVKLVYSIKKGNGEIRRVNINAAPLDIEGFKKVKDSGIGTYQVFQETYHPTEYLKYHLGGKKRDFEWRLTSLDRAQEAKLDDVGIGALFGLYDWRFEVLSLVRHTNHLEACYNVGPHTISFPRIKAANGIINEYPYEVSDDDFARLIAILRLAVPYTGMILTAREPVKLRNELLHFGVSQIDGGTKIELGSYADKQKDKQNLNKEQFEINDERSLNEIIEELVGDDFIPSFCTACYRVGRTGEHFMEFSVPGFIKRFCTPNALLTLSEYLVDYAPKETAVKGWKLIDEKIKELEPKQADELKKRIEQIKQGKRDLYF
jgi:2-iminoacetate synthase